GNRPPAAPRPGWRRSAARPGGRPPADTEPVRPDAPPGTVLPIPPACDAPQPRPPPGHSGRQLARAAVAARTHTPPPALRRATPPPRTRIAARRVTPENRPLPPPPATGAPLPPGPAAPPLPAPGRDRKSTRLNSS